MSAEFQRIDFTYWPETGEIECHGHADAAGDTPPLPVAPSEVRERLLRLIDARPAGWTRIFDVDTQYHPGGADGSGWARHRIKPQGGLWEPVFRLGESSPNTGPKEGT